MCAGAWLKFRHPLRAIAPCDIQKCNSGKCKQHSSKSGTVRSCVMNRHQYCRDGRKQYDQKKPMKQAIRAPELQSLDRKKCRNPAHNPIEKDENKQRPIARVVRVEDDAL